MTVTSPRGQWVKCLVSYNTSYHSLTFTMATGNVNSLHAIFFNRNTNMYLQFLPFLHTDMTPSCMTRTYPVHMVNIMSADDLVVQGTRASAAMILTLWNWDDLVPTRWGSSCCNYLGPLLPTYIKWTGIRNRAWICDIQIKQWDVITHP